MHRQEHPDSLQFDSPEINNKKTVLDKIQILKHTADIIFFTHYQQ